MRVCLILCTVLSAAEARAGTGVADCKNVVDFGATPNSTVIDDDLPAIQSAIVAALATSPPSAVCFPGGTFDIGSMMSGSVAFDLGNPKGTGTPGSLLAFVGAGPATILKPRAAVQTLFDIYNGAQSVVLRDLVIDGSADASATLIKIESRTGDTIAPRDISIDNVTLRNAQVTGLSVIGTAALPVADLAVRNSQFLGSNAAVSIAFAQRVRVHGSFFDTNKLTDLQVGAGVSDLAITDNTLNRTTVVSGATTPVAIGLTGNDTTPGVGAVIANNVLISARLAVRSFNALSIGKNVISGGAWATTDPEISVVGAGDVVTISGNQVLRTTATAAPVCKLAAAAALAPKSVGVHDNVFQQSSDNAIVELDAARALDVTGNYLGFLASSAGTRFGLLVQPPATVNTVVVGDNLIRGNDGSGTLSAAIDLVTPTESRVVIVGNSSRGTTSGVNVVLAAPMTTIPVITANLFDATTDIAGSVANVSAVALAGNVMTGSGVGGPVQLIGTGVPSLVAPIGSTFRRRDGVAGATLYVKETGAGSGSGWVAK